MAATNVQFLNQSDKGRIIPDLIGEGAIALTDALITDIKTYPIGTRYLDITNKQVYFRVAVAGNALADYYVEALTAHA